MRRPSDLPRRRAFGRVSGRVVLIVVAVFLFVLIVFGRALARFYVDYLWHDSLGRSDVFWGVLWAKIALFLAFLVDVPRARRAQPVHRRPDRAEDVPGQRAPVRRALPRGVRAPPAPRALRHRGRARA